MNNKIKPNETYERLTQALDANIVLKSKLGEAMNDLRKEQLKNDTLYKMLSKFLDEFEKALEIDDQCNSIEIAYDYIDAAKYCEYHFDRRENLIRHVQQWIDSQSIPSY